LAKVLAVADRLFELNEDAGRTSSKSDRRIVKVLLRSLETGLFYEAASKWTPNQEAAFDFRVTTQAIELVFAAHLENVEMLLSSEDPQFDLILPIDKKRSSTPSHTASGHGNRKSRGTPGHEPRHKPPSRSSL
jgi:hypothetical protein